MTLELLLRLSLLFAGLFVVGTLLCLPLFHWRWHALRSSQLFVKIVWWIPIFAIFLAALYAGLWLILPLVFLGYLQGWREFRRNKGSRSVVARSYLAFFGVMASSIALLFLFLPEGTARYGLIVLCLASVLSDVCAYFFGSYFGKHHLPAWLNQHKSWEGVFGQIVGAFLGVGLLHFFVGMEISWWLALSIGLGSALGDLYNSAAKRSLNIKDWGNTIPGHGGVLDRFSSLSCASFVCFWLLVAMAPTPIY